MRVYFHHTECFCNFIATTLVVEYHVAINCNAVVVQCLNAVVQLLPGSVLGADGTFLVELSQIITS